MESQEPVEVGSALALVALGCAEALAMALTWRDPALTSTLDRALAMLLWPAVGALAIWRGVDGGLAMSTMLWMGAAVVTSACVFTAGQPGVFFLTIRDKGKMDRARLWRRISGCVGLVMVSIAVGFWVVESGG